MTMTRLGLRAGSRFLILLSLLSPVGCSSALSEAEAIRQEEQSRTTEEDSQPDGGGRPAPEESDGQ